MGFKYDLVMKSVRLLPLIRRSIHAVKNTMFTPWVMLWNKTPRTVAKNDQGQCCNIAS